VVGCCATSWKSCVSDSWITIVTVLSSINQQRFQGPALRSLQHRSSTCPKMCQCWSQSVRAWWMDGEVAWEIATGGYWPVLTRSYSSPTCWCTYSVLPASQCQLRSSRASLWCSRQFNSRQVCKLCLPFQKEFGANRQALQNVTSRTALHFPFQIILWMGGRPPRSGCWCIVLLWRIYRSVGSAHSTLLLFMGQHSQLQISLA